MSKPGAHRKVIWIVGIAAVVMFAFAFAMVPLYSVLCSAIGSNTTTKGELLSESKNLDPSIDLTREIKVQFTATNHKGMPWDFYPQVKSVTVHPGEQTKVFFYAKNMTEKEMVAQAIPSMTPSEGLSHFHKIECFCFRQQALKAGEGKDMPLIFQIDKDIPKEIHVLTLAYTLFDATPTELKPNERKG